MQPLDSRRNKSAFVSFFFFFFFFFFVVSNKKKNGAEKKAKEKEGEKSLSEDSEQFALEGE